MDGTGGGDSDRAPGAGSGQTLSDNVQIGCERPLAGSEARPSREWSSARLGVGIGESRKGGRIR